MKKTGLLPSFLLLLLLAACGESHEQMVLQLEELERQNRADSLMLNDSLALRLADYFDRHGSANERLRAHYILGRTYADMGEAPAALSAYLDAADCADTTQADCDYRTLSRVYGQMSSVFYQQNLMEDYIAACDKSTNYAWKSKDTLQALNQQAYLITAFNRLKQYDLVIERFQTAYQQLSFFGGERLAACYTVLPVNALLAKGRYEEAKQYLEIYEKKSGYFDENNNIQAGRENFYYYKGLLYLNIQQNDSAEYYFRKEFSEGQDVMNQNMASRGLSLLFAQEGRLDSATKYALYSYEMNDSVYAQMATEEVEQAKANYNYHRNKELAATERIRAEKESKRARSLLYAILIVCSIGGYIVFQLFKNKKIREKAYQAKEDELENSLHEILILRSQAEKLAEIITENKKVMSQQTEELAELHSNESGLHKIISMKEESLEHLQLELEMLSKHLKSDLTDVEDILGNSPTYNELQKKAVVGKKLTDEDFSQLYRMVREILPGFYQFITNKSYSLNEAEFNTCVLFRLHVKALGASLLLDKSPAAITKISKSAMMKLFKSEGKSRELIDKLSMIS